ncbi:MAG: AAA family ATPase [Gammaproteobacteria bacterium]|nr:AAA family ATPase [Gammaproteobacteria bacterium]
MDSSDFKNLRCQVIDSHEAGTATHKQVLLIMAQTFDTEGAMILCEPSVVDAKAGTPDIAIIDPESGLHIVEVKGVRLDKVLSIQAGGALEIAYENRNDRRDPLRQARAAMFDVKHAAERHFGGELNVAFECWAVFPRIRRSDWEHKFGDAVSSRTEVLFLDDLESSELGDRMRARGRDRLQQFGIAGPVPEGQIRSLRAAFGDSAVLRPRGRPSSYRKPPEGSLGERLAESDAEYRVLTEQQQALVKAEWDRGPRLVRGVAGSGKTAVMATQFARMVERLYKRSGELFDRQQLSDQRQLLAVCFNRTLVPLVRHWIEEAYRQRTRASLPADMVMVTHFNSLMYHLAQKDMVQYQRILPDQDPGVRAQRYLAELEGGADTELFDAIFVDEGQDFHEDEYRILLKLCRRRQNDLPLFVFYDEAQNLYGRVRPKWIDLGLAIRGRAIVLGKAWRSTQQIVEPAFNVLLGSYAQVPVGTSSFADVATLRSRELIETRDDYVVVKFAPRQGEPIRCVRHTNEEAESAAIAARVEELLRKENLTPQDILVLTFRKERADRLRQGIGERLGPAQVHCVYDEDNKDLSAIQEGRIALSTIHSAKGYEAPFTILASANECEDSIRGRASFYVGCTRARHWLEVSCYGNSSIMAEFEQCIAASSSS